MQNIDNIVCGDNGLGTLQAAFVAFQGAGLEAGDAKCAKGENDDGNGDFNQAHAGLTGVMSDGARDRVHVSFSW